MSEVMAAGSKRADGANIGSWTDGKHQTSVVSASTQLLNLQSNHLTLPVLAEATQHPVSKNKEMLKKGPNNLIDI